jgi:hypothetical protein
VRTGRTSCTSSSECLKLSRLLQRAVPFQRLRGHHLHAGVQAPEDREPGQGRGAPDATSRRPRQSRQQQHRQDRIGDRTTVAPRQQTLQLRLQEVGLDGERQRQPRSATRLAGPEGERHRQQAQRAEEPTRQQLPPRRRHQRRSEREEAGQHERGGDHQSAQHRGDQPRDQGAGAAEGGHRKRGPQAAVPHHPGRGEPGQSAEHDDRRAPGHRGGQVLRVLQQDDDGGAGRQKQQDRRAGAADAADHLRVGEDGRGVGRGGRHQVLRRRPGAQIRRAADADAAPGARHRRDPQRPQNQDQQDHRQPGQGGEEAEEAGGRRGHFGPTPRPRRAAPGPHDRQTGGVRPQQVRRRVRDGHHPPRDLHDAAAPDRRDPDVERRPQPEQHHPDDGVHPADHREEGREAQERPDLPQREEQAVPGQHHLRDGAAGQHQRRQGEKRKSRSIWCDFRRIKRPITVISATRHVVNAPNLPPRRTVMAVPLFNLNAFI